jgi:hypothetical protein
MADSNYMTEAEFRTFIKDDSSLNQSAITLALSVASRAIDAICGRPKNGFVLASTATALYFSPEDPFTVPLEADGVHWEIGTTTSLAVKTDTDYDGVYETTLVLNRDFFLEPVNGARNGLSGWPYDQLTILSSSTLTFPRVQRYARPPVEVTAKWGWSATPDVIKFATALAANRYWGRSDARYGTAGFDAAGFVMRIQHDPDLMGLLAPFIPTARMVA